MLFSEVGNVELGFFKKKKISSVAPFFLKNLERGTSFLVPAVSCFLAFAVDYNGGVLGGSECWVGI